MLYCIVNIYSFIFFYSWHILLLTNTISEVDDNIYLKSCQNLVIMYDIWRIAVESDEFGLWEPTTNRDVQLPNRGATWRQRIPPFFCTNFHDMIFRVKLTELTCGTWQLQRSDRPLATSQPDKKTRHDSTREKCETQHVLHKRNIHFEHNNVWFVHFDKKSGWSADQVWLWVDLVMLLDVNAESLPTFQLFHDLWRVQQFFQTCLKYFEYILNLFFDARFFAFLVFDWPRVQGQVWDPRMREGERSRSHCTHLLVSGISEKKTCSQHVLNREKNRLYTCLYTCLHMFIFNQPVAKRVWTPRSRTFQNVQKHVPRDTVAPAEEVTLGGQRRCNIPRNQTLRSHNVS